MDLRFNLPQSKAHQSLVPGHSVAIPWSRGVGKSWFQRHGGWYLPVYRWDGVERPTVPGGTMRGVRIVHLQPTFKSCKDVHRNAVLAELEGHRAPWSLLGAKVDHTSFLFSFPGGSSLQWFGAKQANAARGIRADIVTVDEADDIDPAVLDAIVRPWFSEPWSLRILLLGGTPRRGRYGLLHREHKRGLDGDAARLLTPNALGEFTLDERTRLEALRLKHSFHATWRDAPGNVDAAFVAQTKADLVASGQLAVYLREWECDFDSAEGLVYAAFNEAIHVRSPPPGIRFTEFLIGVDHGWTDAGVMLVLGVAGSGADATVYLLEEVYEPQQLESWWIEQARRLKAKYTSAPQRWYGDPSQPARLTAIARGAGVRWYDVDNAITDGVGAVCEMLAVRKIPHEDPRDEREERTFARFYVDPSCVKTRYEFLNYKRKRDPNNADKFLDDIVDEWNHSMDCVRYCVFNRFGKPQPKCGVGTSSIGLY
jgi:hypothetical protein